MRISTTYRRGYCFVDTQNRVRKQPWIALRRKTFLCSIQTLCSGWEVGDQSPPSRTLRVELGHRVDLNYRIDLSSDTVRTLLTWPGPGEANLAELRKYDQVSLGSGSRLRMSHGAEGGATAAKRHQRA